MREAVSPRMATLTPMLQVPDIRATIAWYVSVGFSLIETAEEEGELTWALLGYGEGRVMFNCGGHAERRPAPRRRPVPAGRRRRCALRGAARGVIVFESPHDTFYGMREFILRDNNGFWLTFGEPVRRH